MERSVSILFLSLLFFSFLFFSFLFRTGWEGNEMFDFCTLPWNEYPDRYRSIELIAVYTSLSSPPPQKNCGIRDDEFV